MNGPEHYHEAEANLGAALQAGANSAGETAHLRYAQAHATLALVAATVDAAENMHGMGKKWAETIR